MISSLTLMRAAVGLVAIVTCVLLFGPFQGLEARLGLSDKMAHGAAFYVLTLGCFACFPDNRRTDLGLFAILVAGGTEVIQSVVGRDGNFPDFAADSTGIVVALLPATIERLRMSIRPATVAPAQPEPRRS